MKIKTLSRLYIVYDLEDLVMLKKTKCNCIETKADLTMSFSASIYLKLVFTLSIIISLFTKSMAYFFCF